MAIDQDAAKKVLAHIDRDELAQLGCDLTSIPSPTGQEKAIAEFILAWFEANGLKAVRQDVEIDRPNAVGIVKGDGTGLSLGFNGHTDTSFTGTSADLRMVANVEPEAELKGRIVGSKVQGLGISNMKGGVAAIMMAGKALQKSGVKLKGDVIVAAVVGEISRTPIGPWQAPGVSRRGRRNTPSSHPWDALRLCRGGRRLRSQHRLDPDRRCAGQDHDLRQGGGGLGDQALGLSDGEGERHREDDEDHRRAGAMGRRVRGEIHLQLADRPALSQGQYRCIEGGAPYRPNYFPGVCSIYIDVRMPPQVRPVTIKYEMEQVLNKLGLDYELDVYKSLLGHEGRNVEPLVQSAQEAYQHLFGEKIKPESPDRASIWTDTNIYNELGIPAIKIGPRGRRISASERRDRDRRDAEGRTNLRADRARHLQPRAQVITRARR